MPATHPDSFTDGAQIGIYLILVYYLTRSHNMQLKYSFLTVLRSSNLVEVWLRYMPICAGNYLAICTCHFGVLWPGSRFGASVAVQHCIPQPQMALKRKWALGTCYFEP